MAKAREAHFGKGLFRFLAELKQNNNREWFLANKPRYEAEVQVPTLRFIADFAPRLAKITRAFIVDPRPVGGSMMRIYRDTRFAKDKTPYKTNVGAQFRHHAGKDIHAPGFYMHLEPGSGFLGAGMWHPDPKALGQVRDAIVDDGRALEEAAGGQELHRTLHARERVAQAATVGVRRRSPAHRGSQAQGLRGDDDLHREGSAVARFIDRFADSCTAASPLVRFLTDAMGLDF